MKDKNATYVYALGGLGEVGKNMYGIEHNNEILIIDCGVMFPEEDLLGIDYVIQDYTYLKENENKIKALIITHGHEDHIGGIPFLLQQVKIPVIYAPQVAVDLINKKLEDRQLEFKNMQVINAESNITFNNFKVDFITTTHSIPDSFAIVVRTPNGTIIESGDYKFDLTPIGPMADLHKMAKLGEEGVTLYMGESTNALSPGFSESESIVDEALDDMFSKEQTNRIILATFASNIFRIKHIVETCRKHNRKIITFGRSMENAKDIALRNGLITDSTIFIDATKAKDLKKNEICILCTGSQGEPLAALSRIAEGTHKQVTLQPDDVIIFSSNPIPGNRNSVNRVINKLYLKGVKVYTNDKVESLHTSGHGKAGELELMLRLLKPKYFMPIHGEYRMLERHIELAALCDVPKDHSFLCENGDVIVMDKNGCRKEGRVHAQTIYVDGSRIGDVGSVVIKDRKVMSKDGVLITILNINKQKRELMIKPNITTRGFVLVNENAELIKKIENKVSEIVTASLATTYSLTDIKNQIILEISSFINDLTGRRPMIIPVIMEINN
jgi:ribonuclease J